MKAIKAILAVILVLPLTSLGCEPARPVIIPPLTPDGEFKFVYPETWKERFKKGINRENDLAVVKVYVDHHYQSYPRNAQTEIEVLYGWGNPKPRAVTFIRPETSCGKPVPLKVGSRYVALFSPQFAPDLILLNEVAEQIDNLGSPSYVYTSVGLLPRKP